MNKGKYILLAIGIGFAIGFAAVQTVAVLPSDGVLNVNELDFFTNKAQEIAVMVLPKSGFEVFPQEVVFKRLGGVDNYVKECREISCIVELGRKAQVDYVAQCRFGKFGSDLTVNFELYQVSTSGLIDKFVDKAKTINDLLAIMEKRIPDGFRKIPSVSPEAKTAPPSVDGEIKGGVLTDSRDGKKYKTVKIGSQIWMAENLNYAASGSKCYDNKPENCQKYGRLYDWTTAKKVCPSGWHLPSKSEYEVLDNAVGGKEVAGKKLKAKNGWNNYKGKSGNGTNEFGFSALPGGYSFSDGSFFNVGNYGNWWSTSESSSYNAYSRYIGYIDDDADWNGSLESNLYSVRCLQD
ncbi:MAG: fibrobacter succinogenes major paralogous domain-containing protein [Candidatus Fibromonas sp.]|jgi:uncharacterized protein (TIGR02145 family)|nr:fibrobacter succinogenes major paralogous domain-containing protein [Candidatus Fibromonas sp.]